MKRRDYLKIKIVRNKPILFTDYYIYWEPGAAQGTLSYFQRLPALVDFTGKLNIHFKSRPTQFRISKPS